MNRKSTNSATYFHGIPIAAGDITLARCGKTTSSTSFGACDGKRVEWGTRGQVSKSPGVCHRQVTPCLRSFGGKLGSRIAKVPFQFEQSTVLNAEAPLTS